MRPSHDRAADQPVLDLGEAVPIWRGPVSTSALGAGCPRSRRRSATLTAPTTPGGTYYVWVITDDFQHGPPNQSNTSNDLQHSVAFSRSGPRPPPPPAQSDLIPTNITLGSTTVAPG